MIYESTTIKTRAIATSDDSCAIKTTKTVVKVNGLRVQVCRSSRSRLEPPPPEKELYEDEYDDYYDCKFREACRRACEEAERNA